MRTRPVPSRTPSSRLSVRDGTVLRRLERQMAERMGVRPTQLGPQAVGQLAELQGGCVARWQLRFLGMADSSISRLTNRNGWTQVHQGVWRVPGARDDTIAMIWAAVLAVGEREGPLEAAARLTPDADPLTVLSQVAARRAVLTAGTAAWVYRLWRTPPTTPALLVDSQQHPQRVDIRFIRTGLDRFDGAVVLGGLWVAGCPRTVWDVGHLLRRRADAPATVADLVITADRLRLMPADDLVAMVDEPCLFSLPMRVPGVIRRAAELVRPGFSHSRTEARGRQIAGEVAAGLGLIDDRPGDYARQVEADLRRRVDEVW